MLVTHTRHAGVPSGAEPIIESPEVAAARAAVNRHLRKLDGEGPARPIGILAHIWSMTSLDSINQETRGMFSE